MDKPNPKLIISVIILLTGAFLAVYGYLSWGPFHIAFGGGLFVVVLAIVLYVKRSRWGYWWAMLTGKKHIETFVRHDAQDYDSMNQEPNLARGRAMEKTAIGLIWIVSLGGQMLMPFLGFQTMAIIAGIAIVAALMLFVLKKVLGYYEFKEHATQRHVVVEYVDMDGNEGELFFEDARFSGRVIVEQNSLIRVLNSIDKQLQTMRTERATAGEAALKELPDDIREQIEKIQSLAEEPDELESAVAERIKASKVVRQFFRVGIDQEVQFDYTEEEAVRQAIIDGDKDEKGKPKTKSKKNPAMTVSEAHVQSSRHLVCRLCGEPLKKSAETGFYFKCEQCKVDTNAVHVLEGPTYEPHIYTLYPGGELKRRCLLVFPVKLNDALDPTAKLRVRFHYETFLATAHYIRTIKLGTLKEVLYDGELIDGIHIELPDNITTLDTEVPVFVATDFDYAEKRRLAGLQMVKPPPLIEHFIRLVKAIVQVSIMGRKLEDKEIEISKLRESRSRIRAMYESLKVEQEMTQADILPDVRVPEVQKPPPEPKGLRRLQVVAISMVWFAIGAIFTWFLLPALGWRVFPPIESASTGLALQNPYGSPIPVFMFLLVFAALSGTAMLFVERKFGKLFLLGLTSVLMISALLCAILAPGWVVIP